MSVLIALTTHRLTVAALGEEVQESSRSSRSTVAALGEEVQESSHSSRSARVPSGEQVEHCLRRQHPQSAKHIDDLLLGLNTPLFPPEYNMNAEAFPKLHQALCAFFQILGLSLKVQKRTLSQRSQ